MLTIEELKKLGADTEDGIARCMGNEDFYLRMVKMALDDDRFEKLGAAVRAGDLKDGFEMAHALKGILTNVSLTTLAEPVTEITEDLRERRDKDYSEVLSRIETVYKEYRKLISD